MPWVLTLWDKTNGAVKSLGAMDSMPLQMAAAQAFGPGNATKLDHLTVSLSHPDVMTPLLCAICVADAHSLPGS